MKSATICLTAMPDDRRDRALYLDSACGILIINMIAYHCWQWSALPPNPAWLRVFSFFMPWFFFKAGMFHRPDSIDRVVKKSWNRLLKPYILYTIIGTLVLWVAGICLGEEGSFIALCRESMSSIILESGAPAGNRPLWFLVVLFFTRLSFTLIDKIMKRHQWLLIILPLTLHLTLDLYPLRIPFYVSDTLSGLAYYAIGHCLKDYRPSMKWLIALLLIYATVMTLAPQIVDMHYDRVISGTYLGWFVVSVIGITAFNEITRLTLNSRNLMSWTGRNSLDFYCRHWIVLTAVSVPLSLLKISGIHCFIIELTLILLTLYLLELMKQSFQKSRNRV